MIDFVEFSPGKRSSWKLDWKDLKPKEIETETRKEKNSMADTK